MKKSEIKAIVKARIEGQGTSIDAGNALPPVLNALTENYADHKEVDDFEEFDESTSYSVGDIVRYDGALKKFTAAHQGVWKDADAVNTSVFAILKALIDANSLEISSLDARVEALEG